MPRPRKCRKVCRMPKYCEFAPAETDRIPEETVVLSVDEYEALRLIDNEGFSQEECSEYMQVARTTVQQIYTSARKKIAYTLVKGCRLSIKGGDYCLCDVRSKCCSCGCMRDSKKQGKGEQS